MIYTALLRDLEFCDSTLITEVSLAVVKCSLSFRGAYFILCFIVLKERNYLLIYSTANNYIN